MESQNHPNGSATDLRKPRSLPINWREWLPSRGNVLLVVLVIGGLLWAQTAGALPSGAPAAQSSFTGTIAYQGRLADGGGTPVTDKLPMVFRFYEAAAGGAPLWEENWTGSNSVAISDGLFNVMLGSITPIPESVVASNTSLWLGITVDADNEMTPRVQMGSVPFAAQALTVLDQSITTAKLADDAVTNEKQTIKTFRAEDNTQKDLAPGAILETISTFNFDNVPAGDVAITLTLFALCPRNGNCQGTIAMFDGNEQLLDQGATHLLGDSLGSDGGYHQMFLHGHIPDFPGGTLTVTLKGVNDPAAGSLQVGAGPDPRFGRHITIIAGL